MNEINPKTSYEIYRYHILRPLPPTTLNLARFSVMFLENLYFPLLPPDWRLARSASWSTRPPLATLTRKLELRICARNSLLTMCRVLELRLAVTITISDSEARLYSSTFSAPTYANETFLFKLRI